MDFSTITRQVPAFKPIWTARKGAEELYDAYRRFGLTPESFGQRFKRLPWLS